MLEHFVMYSQDATGILSQLTISQLIIEKEKNLILKPNQLFHKR